MELTVDLSYALTPFLAWLVAGISKFLINSARAKQWAFGLIGYGGMPSNHSAIVSSMAALIAFKEGIEHPAFGVALALAFIVMLDASSLRRQVGKHATAINTMMLRSAHITQTTQSTLLPILRERMGHTPFEILGGVLTGVLVAYGVNLGMPLLMAVV
ncbi:divergent PAP2 family protein [Thiomicrorhabdus aquaedulcis]|uniref:divergent PAP2 family protein n=1 Tax=Thiomicrorhabdus aquaedulcis TaxID=2211106 RepID=UPI000FD8F540|nr:divergent PAP2 family protein [Thiomicrorhabdus aquaedulcis]